MGTPVVTVRTITPEVHLRWLRTQPSASFLQTPAWGRLKNDWRSESLGWYAGDRLVGVGLVLYRQLPVLRRHLAYLPEGPLVAGSAELESRGVATAPLELVEILRPLREHVRARGAFTLRIGPPVVTRRWHATTIKDAIGDPGVESLTEVAPDVTEEDGVRMVTGLERLGFTHLAAEDGFSVGQPQFVFQVPLAGRTEAELLAGMNQLWRRNIKKSAKLGVQVSRGTAADLPAFHAVYLETAARDGFTPRPLAYFQRMFEEMLAEDPDRIRLYLARHDGDLVAATTWVRVGGHVWYSYGASTSAKREVQGSTAVQWQMIRDARSAGASVYDLRGITDTISEDDPHLGLVRFKVGTGGDAVEYVGEWDLPLRRVLHAAFRLYMSRR